MDRIVLWCGFPEQTANTILMRGRAEAMHGTLILQPFKDRQDRRNLLLWALRVPTVLWQMLRAEVVVIHKALPPSMLYLVLLRVLRWPSGKPRVVLILDDLEGINGFASVRYPRRPLVRTLISLCEEWAPHWADGVVCVSRFLYDKVRRDMQWT